MITGFIWSLFWLLHHLSRGSCSRHLCSWFQDYLLLSSICWNSILFPTSLVLLCCQVSQELVLIKKRIRYEIHSSEEFSASCLSFCLRVQLRDCLESVRLKTRKQLWDRGKQILSILLLLFTVSRYFIEIWINQVRHDLSSSGWDFKNRLLAHFSELGFCLFFPWCLLLLYN